MDDNTLINWFGTAYKLSKIIKKPIQTVYTWRRKNKIPDLWKKEIERIKEKLEKENRRRG